MKNTKIYTTINILTASDKELENISKIGLLSLTLEEMRCIKNYFVSLNRNPTDCELETIAQTWSEHCKHKTLTSKATLVYYNKINGRKKKIIKKYDNVLKETIFYSTKKINHKMCLSVFNDNAGIVEFDDKYAVAFKVETHNHPSALEPYGGAATGVGGVIRDVIGCGLGAKPIANTDIFCFGEINYSGEIPDNVHHPKRIFKGVVSGVRDYGNRMGIPTVNGSIIFDNGYVFNPIVYCGCVGLIPKDKIKKNIYPGQMIVLVGGRTGRDGIHGATFSSSALHKGLTNSVVQVGDAVTEKMFLDVLLKSRDLGLYTAITDCGAGGLSSACGELAKDYGCEIFLENVLLKYKSLLPWEIWISESQERMVVIVDSDKKDEFIKLCSSEDVEASVIGKITNTKKLEVYFKNLKVCDLDMDFLHNGNPKSEFNLEYNLPTVSTVKEQIFVSETNYLIKDLIEKVLAHPNICSKEWVIRQYDFEVQGNTILKPLVGDMEICFEKFSPQDAAIIKPLIDSKKCVAISCGINPLYGKYDVVSMTESVIDEAIRNIVCVGGNLDKIFLLDNYCWGDATDKEQLSSLFLSCEIAKNVAEYFGTPFISGKDSLNNYFLLNNKRINIPKTLLISAIGIIDDFNSTISSEFKGINNEIYLVGETNINEVGGSILFDILQKKAVSAPRLNYKIAKKIYLTFSKLKQHVLSAHDCSDGGIITTIIEMTFGRKIGVELNLSKLNNVINFLFSESNSRIVVEVTSENKRLFEKILQEHNVPFMFLGKTVFKPYVLIKYREKNILEEKVELLYNIWSKGLQIN